MSLLDLIEAATGAAQPPFGRSPARVVVDRAGLALALITEDGEEARACAEALRLACRCAWCTRARIDGAFPDRFEAVAIQDAEPIGGYALRLRFSDGHDRGIFPWSFIREIASAASPPEAAGTPDRTLPSGRTVPDPIRGATPAQPEPHDA